MSGGSWVGKHKKELLAALALGGGGLAGAGALGLLGGGSAATGFATAAGGEAATPFVSGLTGALDPFAVAAGGEAATPFVSGASASGGLLGNVGNAFDKFGKVQRLAGLLSPQQEPIPPMQMPQGGIRQAPLEQSNPTPSMQQTYGQPTMDPETLRRLRAQMMMRGGYG